VDAVAAAQQRAIDVEQICILFVPTEAILNKNALAVLGLLRRLIA
jgi:hypothetical protein